MSSFTEGDSVLQVLIATIALVMGVNPPNVCYVLHCGPSHDVESYVQEIGRIVPRMSNPKMSKSLNV